MFAMFSFSPAESRTGALPAPQSVAAKQTLASTIGGTASATVMTSSWVRVPGDKVSPSCLAALGESTADGPKQQEAYFESTAKLTTTFASSDGRSWPSAETVSATSDQTSSNFKLNAWTISGIAAAGSDVPSDFGIVLKTSPQQPVDTIGMCAEMSTSLLAAAALPPHISFSQYGDITAAAG
ncbi:hypothetical protein [Rudaeicoccus suwonensis]|uniref:hypothetical protein n=1 Tax=Rudaeicoccus suwonensis TaxID=657409 RepID=UPI0011A226AE|nr:hypothetical protein [Rudaeicoccus suwonensis]